jgi:hypothetical protein
MRYQDLGVHPCRRHLEYVSPVESRWNAMIRSDDIDEISILLGDDVSDGQEE